MLLFALFFVAGAAVGIAFASMHPKLDGMLEHKLRWKRPLFFLLLPIFLIMIFLGFPLAVAPPPATKARQEEVVPETKKRRHRRPTWLAPNKDRDEGRGR